MGAVGCYLDRVSTWLVKSWPSARDAARGDRGGARLSTPAQVWAAVPQQWRSDAWDRLTAAIAAYRAACEPAGFAEALVQVAAIHAVLPRQGRADADHKVLLRLIAEDLAEYPADVLRDACREVRRGERWMPAPAVVIDACERRVRRRRDTLELLELLLDAGGQPDRAPAAPRCTADEAVAIRDRCEARAP